MKHMLHVRSKSFFDVLAMTRFKTLFPIMIIAIFASFFLFALVSLSVAVEHGYSPLAADAVAINMLVAAATGHIAWIAFGRGLPLTRKQNMVAACFIVPTSWLPPRILVNIPEMDWGVLTALGGIVAMLMWLVLTNIHRRIFHDRIALNITRAAEIDDPDNAEVKRLSTNSVLPNAVIFWAVCPSIAITDALSNWAVTSFFPAHTIIVVAGGSSSMLGLLAYNFLPGQADIRDFISRSRSDRKTQ